ncbi:glycerol-1-phosphatase [Marmoricola sp. URHA0025 HA25]
MTRPGDATVQGRLIDRYAALVCDLDGVVYRGRRAVTGAVETLGSVMGEGVHVAFATNNASRAPTEVMSHLEQLGVAPPARSPTSLMVVVTSAQAAAQIVRRRLEPGSAVLAVGGPGVAEALRAAGLEPFSCADAKRFPRARAVVQGAGSDVSWRDLAEAAYRIQQGALWVVTNGDRTIPTARGLAPGNGALAEAVRAAVGVDAVFAGKPAPGLYEHALSRLGVVRQDALVVGDRLDTDVAGAVAAGMDSLMVLGGAHGLVDAVHCDPATRPTYLGVDLRALLIDHERSSDEPMEPLLVERGMVAGPVLDPDRPTQALDQIVRAAWKTLDDGGELPRHAEAWRLLEDEIRGAWCGWWDLR